MNNCYKELPENYKIVKIIDAKDDKSLVVKFNIAAIVLMIGAIILFALLKFKTLKIFNLDVDLLKLSGYFALFFVLMIAYMILHELVHGAIYKVLTKEKLTFGMTLSVAFCGVPNVYVTKKTAMLALCGPLIVFTLIFIPLIFVLNGAFSVVVIALFAVHFGGCVGDMYCMYILGFKLKGDILMNDTGPKQTFYKKID